MNSSQTTCPISSAASSSSFLTYVFHLRRSRLAPLSRPELGMWWYSKPDRRGYRAFGSTGGLKIGKSGYIRQVSGAGAAITPCRSGGSGRCSWTSGRRRRQRSASTLLHSALWWDQKKKTSLSRGRKYVAGDTHNKQVPASSSGSSRFGLGPSVLVPSCSRLMWRITAVALKACCRVKKQQQKKHTDSV